MAPTAPQTMPLQNKPLSSIILYLHEGLLIFLARCTLKTVILEVKMLIFSSNKVIG